VLDAYADAASVQEQLREIHLTLRGELPGVVRVAVALYDRRTDVIKTFVHSTEGAAQPFLHYEARLHDVPSLAELAAHGDDPAATAAALIEAALTEMFAGDDAHRFLEVTYASGEKETLYFKDFVSGAMIESVCTRGKKSAVKRMIVTGVKGIATADLVEAVKAEFRENEDLPNTTNPDDWAKIAGRRGERIVHVRPVFDREAKKPRKVENISTGHYL